MDYTIHAPRDFSSQWRGVTSTYVDGHGDHLELYVRPHPDNAALSQANDDGYCHFELRTLGLHSAIKKFVTIFGLELNNHKQVEFNAPSTDLAIRSVFVVMIAVNKYIMRELDETLAICAGEEG